VNVETVNWEFLVLSNLESLPADGTEIKSRFLRKKDPAKLVCNKEDLTVLDGNANGRTTGRGATIARPISPRLRAAA